MDARYVRMRQARVANVHLYNAQALPDDRMPTLWLIHDEFAEWMLTEEYKKAVASAVQRLGVKARAAGSRGVIAARRQDGQLLMLDLTEKPAPDAARTLERRYGTRTCCYWKAGPGSPRASSASPAATRHQ